MRVAALALALGASLNLAIADVICNTEAVHSKPRIVTEAEKDGFASSIEELCNTNNTETHSKSQSGLTVFSITRGQGTISDSDCEDNFNSIIEECVAGRNFGGGSFVTNGLTLEISVDTSVEQALKARSLDVRARNKKMAKGKTHHVKSKPKPKPKPKSNSKPKPKSKTNKPKAPPKSKKLKPFPKSCPVKGSHGKKNTPGKKNAPGKKTTHGKSPKHGVRDVVSNLFPRIPTSDCIGRANQPMTRFDDWGLVWFGVTRSTGSLNRNHLRNFAHLAYQQARTDARTNLQDNNDRIRILVSVLYIPGWGVAIGTAPEDDVSKTKIASEVNSIRRLERVYANRHLAPGVDPRKGLYHAKDLAIFFAYHLGAIGPNDEAPFGSKIYTYGQYAAGDDPKKIAACIMGSVRPSCHETLQTLEITESV